VSVAAFLHVRAVTKAPRQHGVDLTVATAETLALRGANGAGKTTSGAALGYSTHLMEEAERLCDRVAAGLAIATSGFFTAHW
jgi:ABC-type multidrug transport system ATPase subunit